MTAQIFFIAAYTFGFSIPDANRLTCIAKHESAFKLSAVNVSNSNGTTDHGILQINDIWLDTHCKGMDLYTLNGSLQCAEEVIDHHGFNAWVGYNKNKKECDNGKRKRK